MTQYVKFISETKIEYPPQNKDAIINYNLDINRLIIDGYKVFKQIERPETDRHYEIHYTNNRKTIEETLVWTESEEAYAARKLQESKTAKEQENAIKRNSFLVEPVLYKNILWDADLEQKINLAYAIENLPEGETTEWIGTDGISTLNATKEDLQNILDLLAVKTTYVWQIKNPQIKTLINNASTIEEVEAIEIIYDLHEVEN